MTKFNISILIFILLASCDNNIGIIYPTFGDSSVLTNAQYLDKSIIENIQGIYSSSNPDKRLGENIVVKSTKNKLTVYCGQSIDFILLDGGIIDSGIVFEGYGRDLETANVNQVRILIKNNDGADELLKGKIPDSISMLISVLYDSQTGRVNQTNQYDFVRKLSNSKNFKIIAHRGGARNSDLLPASENSLGMIKYAEYLGANGIEIDIRLTKDRIPILFHDDYISKRLINGDLLVGRVENYYFSHLRTFCTLKNDEQIPTLEEALSTVIENTNLDFVWLDIKTPAVIDVIVPIILKYNEIAKSKNREVDFYIGITSTQVQNQLMTNPDYSKMLSLSELSTVELEKSKSKIWAPQWTLGYQNEIVNDLKSKGIKSYVWTMDERNFIKEFLDNGKFDGILTNYAPIAAYEYYIRN
jgi:glycerophosphoryl diester phosphodiesterase